MILFEVIFYCSFCSFYLTLSILLSVFSFTFDYSMSFAKELIKWSWNGISVWNYSPGKCQCRYNAVLYSVLCKVFNFPSRKPKALAFNTKKLGFNLHHRKTRRKAWSLFQKKLIARNWKAFFVFIFNRTFAWFEYWINKNHSQWRHFSFWVCFATKSAQITALEEKRKQEKIYIDNHYHFVYRKQKNALLTFITSFPSQLINKIHVK